VPNNYFGYQLICQVFLWLIRCNAFPVSNNCAKFEGWQQI